MSLFNTREISYAPESSFAQYADAPGSATWSTRIPVLQATLDLGQDRQADGSIFVRANESRAGYLMPKTATLELTMHWCGANAATSGAVSETWQQDLLADALGGGFSSAAVGGIASGVPTAVSVPFTGGTFTAGAAVRVGTKGDSGGDGQFAIIGATATTPLALLTALPAAPAVGAVVHAAQVAYPTETGQTTKRFLIGWSATGIQYALFGCQVESISLSTPMGGIPTLTLRYRVAYWTRTTFSVPQVATLSSCEAAPSAGGSVFYNTFGTTTRATLSPVEIGLTLDMGLSVIEGLGGQPYQTIVGYERTMCVPTLSMKVAWSTDHDALYDADGGDSTYKHVLVTFNPTAKRAVGAYLSRAYIVGPRPMIENYNELTYHTVVFKGAESTTTTNDLTRSAFRLLSA
jgi:hypothetical protein